MQAPGSNRRRFGGEDGKDLAPLPVGIGSVSVASADSLSVVATARRLAPLVCAAYSVPIRDTSNPPTPFPIPTVVALSTLYVLALSDSFSALWEELAREAGAVLAVSDSAAGVGTAPDALAVLVAAGGAEDEAEDAV
ncbi:MAG: hypothetical protein JWM27_1733, partial [Gemmatimonadetes bacterium]|nr:hypothetical protein [Gemmatimonadota bacterium]